MLVCYLDRKAQWLLEPEGYLALTEKWSHSWTLDVPKWKTLELFQPNLFLLLKKKNVCSLDANHRDVKTQNTDTPVYSNVSRSQMPGCVHCFFHLHSTLLGELTPTLQNKQKQNIALLLPDSRLWPGEMQRLCKSWTGTPVCALSVSVFVPWGRYSKRHVLA